MATAEYVTKVHAICVKCGGIASYSYRLSEETQKVMLGEKDKYEPRCRKCFRPLVPKGGNLTDSN
jgi:thymidine kinase